MGSVLCCAGKKMEIEDTVCEMITYKAEAGPQITGPEHETRLGMCGAIPSQGQAARTRSVEQLAATYGCAPDGQMMALEPARQEPCTACGMPVFIAERLLVGGHKLFHRACFRCARCHNQLSLANCYHTEDGDYCCEACLDEVDIKASDSLTSNDVDDNNKTSGSLTLDLTEDHNSANFESVVNRALCDRPDSVVETKQNEQSSNAMSNFMIGQLQFEPEEMLQPFPPSVMSEQAKDTSVLVYTDRFSHVNSTSAALDLSNSDINNSLGDVAKDKSSDFFTKTTPRLVVVDNDVKVVPLVGCSIKHSDRGQPLTANDRVEDCDHDQNKLITKCTKESDDAPPSSIVKMRMQMFDHREENTTKIKYSSRISAVLSKKSEDSVETYRPNSLKPECNVAPMPELVSDISMPDIALPMDQEESKVSVKFEEEVILLPDTMYESNLPSNEVSKSEDINEQKKLELDHNEINTQVPNFEEHIKPREENVSTDISSIANLKKITVPVAHLEHANKVVQAITTNLPVVPSAEYVANSDTIAKETTSEALPDQAVHISELNPFGDDGESDKGDSKGCAASTNPFGSDDNDDEHVVPAARGKPPRPPLLASRQSDKLLKVSVNPHKSDREEPKIKEETNLRRKSIPRPRTLLNVSTLESSPKVRLGNTTGRYGSTNSLSSTSSSRNSTMHCQKKHTPPPHLPSSSPPLPRSATPHLSPSPSPAPSPKSVPRQPHKAQPAPPPLAAEPPQELKKITVSYAFQSELYLHHLEEEHADLEYQIRCLLEQPDHAKTDTEKAYEEDLIQRLADVVESLDEVVNYREMDRKREAEEDCRIHPQLPEGNDGDANIEGATVTHQKNALKKRKRKVKKKSKGKLRKKK